MWAVVAAEQSPFISPTREQADSRTLIHRVVLEKSNFPRIIEKSFKQRDSLLP
ncbi:mCG1045341, isoform CRA_a [Mus musculus]|nr:mCG1045341, isoform CRA_a [Mus musculus]